MPPSPIGAMTGRAIPRRRSCPTGPIPWPNSATLLLVLTFSGGSTISPVSGISWHVQGAPNSFPTTCSGEFGLRCMWVGERTVWEGPWALLAQPWGIVHTLNKAECNTGHLSKHLDVCTAQVLFITTP